jgi:valyl-tRNA synthetase
MTGYTLGDIPFKKVYLHGIIRDAKGKKMSKSLNNSVDPTEVIQKFGADACRMALIVGNTPGTDSKWSDDKVKAYKNFANKVWNITRFILESTTGTNYDSTYNNFTDEDKKLIEERAAFVKDITLDIEGFRFYMAGEKIYHYVWHTLADVILENSKGIFNGEGVDNKASRKQFLLGTLETILKVLHPFMPFLTEEIWQSINDGKSMLMIEKWPV